MKIQRGVSLIEALVAIGLAGAMIAAVAAAIYSSRLRDQSRHRSQATALAVGEIAAIRALSAMPADRTNQPFIEMTLGRGSFLIANGVLDIREPSPSAAGGVTTAIVVPTNRVGDATLTAAINVAASPPSNWRVGFAVRSRDLGNQYRYTIGATTVTFEKIVNGTATTLFTDTIATTPGTSVTLDITMSASTFTLRRQGVEIGSVTDTTFGSGDLVLLGQNAVDATFDDVAVTGDAAASWNFASDDPAWKRVALTDLPGGADELTIENAFAGASLKKITARVKWQSTRGPEKVEAVTYAQ